VSSPLVECAGAIEHRIDFINVERRGTTPLRCKLRTMCGSRTGGWSLPCVMSD
jgi:hypothetical protein